MKETTTEGLQERQDTPQVLPASAETFNATTPQHIEPCGKPSQNESKPLSHAGCGYNSRKRGGMSAHNVFVLSVEGQPLTPTTNAKARKLMKGKQAKPVWNKYGRFGMQMLVDTRTETPNTVLGVDFGTKFEGYVVVVGKENNLSVMWKLPDKKKIVRKLEERRQLRRARRFRNCRKRPCRSDNRNKEGFIAPSQNVMMQSRLKAMREFFKCYPISVVALEDVCFNHRDKRWGRNFSTIEIGKKKINNWIRERALLSLYKGFETQDLRKKHNYKKSSKKDAEVFTAHCSDALAIAIDIYAKEHITPNNFLVVDDTYRPVRRKLHDAQFSKGGIRYKYSTGNAFGTRKGTMCALGQICGATGNNYRIYDYSGKRIAKTRTKITWLSKQFKHHSPQFPTPTSRGVPLRVG